ncbi:T9SS type A sorting domain-containing protein [Tamlana sp. 62-3]|uniref:T9SS type A sorting domain-containing protein n=1 Tax=Neotamlana sargassicola TaxID=2883125 RepID=A0A9X1I5M1_9FLAO|nr:sialate O-acetylesterase [Tamlana sargassicola]MCB4807878.1 T9SS type A sorting domain-containing protein [Tamlana sargassicola]
MKIILMKPKAFRYLLLCLLVLPIGLFCQNSKVFLVIGQSNAAGRGELPDPLPELNNVLVLNGAGKFEKATPALNIYSTIRDQSKTQGYNLGYTFGQAMHDNIGEQIHLVVNARAGSSIDAWEIGASQNYYGEAVARTHEALQELGSGAQLAGIIWHQGESNYARTTYIAQLSAIIEGFRTEFGNPNLPFIAGEISYENKNYLNFNYDLISNLTSSVSNTEVVSAEGLTTVPEDDIHFNALSQKILGNRYAVKMLQMMGYTNINVNIPEPDTNGITHFIPDPSREYYIQSVAGKRLAANGSNNFATAEAPTVTGNTVTWKFINSGDDGLYHVELASGGNRPRLQSNNSGTATMQPTSSSGSWTKFIIEERTYGEGVYHITAPFGSDGERRLYLDSTNGTAGMYALSNEGDESTFSIVETNSLSVNKVANVSFSSFPNPFADRFTIKGLNPSIMVKEAKVVNLNGNILKVPVSINRSEIQVYAENLSAGVYLVLLKTDKGNFTSRVIKN